MLGPIPPRSRKVRSSLLALSPMRATVLVALAGSEFVAAIASTNMALFRPACVAVLTWAGKAFNSKKTHVKVQLSLQRSVPSIDKHNVSRSSFE